MNYMMILIDNAYDDDSVYDNDEGVSGDNSDDDAAYMMVIISYIINSPAS